MKAFYLEDRALNLEDIYRIAHAKKGVVIRLGKKELENLQKSRDFILKTAKNEKAVYGINTGFGALSHTRIKDNDLADLQLNLVRSHCTGVGKPFPREVVRAIMLLRAICLIPGKSGINPSAIQLLLDFIEHDVTPIVPEKGSVGASGDLAPLAHMALCLIGEGNVSFENKTMNALKAIESIGKKPLILGPKDGLALINGTAVMTALGALCLYETKKLAKLADIATALSLEGLKGSIKAFDPKIANLRPYPGQREVCHNIHLILQNSNILQSHQNCHKVQDPYSLRCVPQVHGASRQVIKHVQDILSIEMNSVTDNPLVFPDEEEVISGGNFHGAPVALAMDYLAMGISEFGSISERRIEKLMNSTFSELPSFLSPRTGLHSGFMMAQVTAAALASENKIFCHPASIDSIPTSTDKEDHVSMGVTAGRKLFDLLFNVKRILAIEFLCSAQAIDFHRPLTSSRGIEACHQLIRRVAPYLDKDRALNNDIEAIVTSMETGDMIKAVESQTGELL